MLKKCKLNSIKSSIFIKMTDISGNTFILQASKILNEIYYWNHINRISVLFWL
jgi:hypothetical protein